MQLHQIKPKNKKKDRKRIGRGNKKGTYSGRGIKGQKARAGRKLQPIIRQIIKKYPKLRGYNFNPIQNKPPVEIVNLSQIEVKFKEGDVITPKVLVEKGLVKKIKGKIPQVKILGKGEITKKIIVKECLISQSAKEKIEKAKGKIEEPS